MSWEDNLNDVKFEITTGDGKKWQPLWKTGEKSVEYNVAAFNFIDVDGTLVERKQPQSGKFPLTFWFEGADNIDQCKRFDASAADRRVWSVTHPLYGTLKGHPVSIKYNDEFHNITEVTVEFWQSIDADYPNSNFSVKDNTYDKSREVLESCSRSYVQPIATPAPADIVKNKQANIVVAASFQPLQTNNTFPDYQNALATAQSLNDRLLTEPLAAIEACQKLVDLPSTYQAAILNRVAAYKTAFDKIKSGINTIMDKLFFQSQGGSLIASYANAAVNPTETDYQILPEIEQVSTGLLQIYSEYLAIIDGAAVSQYDVGNTWQPDAAVQNTLQDLVFYTLGNLYTLSLDAQQERIVYTTEDTNLILLTHRYMGLDADDANMERFRTINNIKTNELFKIKKGREIKYYV